MIPKTISDLMMIWAALFGIEKYDRSKSLKDNVPGFDKVDELMAIIAVEDLKGEELSEEQVASLKASGFTEEALTSIFC